MNQVIAYHKAIRKNDDLQRAKLIESFRISANADQNTYSSIMETLRKSDD